MDSVSGDYAFDSTYSNQLHNHYYTEQLDLNYRWINEKIDLMVGIRGLATQTRRHSAARHHGLFVQRSS